MDFKFLHIINDKMLHDLSERLGSSLTYFRHLRQFKDLRRFDCCSNESWIKRYYQGKFYEIAWLDGPPSLYKNSIFAWDVTLKSSLRSKKFIAAIKEVNIHHGLSVIRCHDKYVDIFEFAVAQDDSTLTCLAIYLPKVIDDVIDYWLDKNDELLSSLEQKTITLDLRSTYVPHYEAFSFNNEVGIICEGLPPQQLKCLQYLSKGLSAKEIATLMSLSSRTVEHYINLIIKKAGAKSRLDLVKLWLEYQRLSKGNPYVIDDKVTQL